MRSRRIPVDDPSTGETLGYIDRHVFVFESWSKKREYALSNDVLDLLVDKGVDVVVIQERNARRLTSSIEDWQEFGRPRGRETILSVSYMAVG